MPELNEFLLVFHFDSPVMLPDNPVALLRGLLGRALAHRLHPDLPPHAPESDIPAGSPYWPLFKPAGLGGGETRPPYLLESAWGRGPALSLHARLRTFGGTPSHARVYAEALEAHPRLWLGEAGSAAPCRMEWTRLEPGQWPAFPEPGAPPVPMAVEFSSPAQFTVKMDPPHGKTPLEMMLFHPHTVPPTFLGRDADPLPLLAYAAALSAARVLIEFGAALPEMPRPPLSHFLHAAAHDGTRFFRAALRPYNDTDTRKTGRQPASGVMGRLELLAEPRLAWLLQCGSLTGVGSRISHGCGRMTLQTLV